MLVLKRTAYVNRTEEYELRVDKEYLERLNRDMKNYFEQHNVIADEDVKNFVIDDTAVEIIYNHGWEDYLLGHPDSVQHPEICKILSKHITLTYPSDTFTESLGDLLYEFINDDVWESEHYDYDEYVEDSEDDFRYE
jgi:hypothetical protein